MTNGLAEISYIQTQCDAHFKFQNGHNRFTSSPYQQQVLCLLLIFQSSFKESQTSEVVIENIDMQRFKSFL